MSAIKIEQEKLEASVGELVKILNSDVLEKMTGLAQVVMSDEENAIMEQAREDCKKFQTHFNVTKESLHKFLQDMGDVIEIDQYLKKLDITSVQQRDTSFGVKGINKDAIMK